MHAWLEDTLHGMLNTAVDGKYKIMWPNTSFNTENLNAWLTPFFVPASDSIITLGDQGDIELVGFYQVTIRTAINSGTEVEREIIDMLNTTYKCGKTYVKDDKLLRLRYRSFSSGGQVSISDFAQGSIEKAWKVNHFTVHWLAREMR